MRCSSCWRHRRRFNSLIFHNGCSAAKFTVGGIIGRWNTFVNDNSPTTLRTANRFTWDLREPISFWAKRQFRWQWRREWDLGRGLRSDFRWDLQSFFRWALRIGLRWVLRCCLGYWLCRLEKGTVVKVNGPLGGLESYRGPLLATIDSGRHTSSKWVAMSESEEGTPSRFGNCRFSLAW